MIATNACIMKDNNISYIYNIIIVIHIYIYIMTIFKMILRYFKINSSKFREITRNIILGITHSLVYPWFNLSTDVPRIFFRRFRAEMEFLDMPPCHVFPMSNGFRGRKPAAY